MNLMLALFVAIFGIIVFGVIYERRMRSSLYIPIEEVKGFEYLKNLDPSTVKEWVYIDGTVKMPDGTEKRFCGKVPKLDHCKDQNQVEHDLQLISSCKDPEVKKWLEDFSVTMDNLTDEEVYRELHQYAEKLRDRGK